MKRWIGLGVAGALALTPAAASADDTGGHAGIALAGIVGLLSPHVTVAQKAVLTAYLAGRSGFHPHAAPITVTASKITCGAGDVDITDFHCELDFSGATRNLTARAAHELWATLAEVGVQSDGAAGAIYEGLTDLKCVLTPSDISDNGGAGATCTFAQGQ